MPLIDQTQFRAHLRALEPGDSAGKANSAHRCPLAVFIRAAGWDFAEVPSGNVTVARQTDDGTWTLVATERLPEWAATFVGTIDLAYPHGDPVPAGAALAALAALGQGPGPAPVAPALPLPLPLDPREEAEARWAEMPPAEQRAAEDAAFDWAERNEA